MFDPAAFRAQFPALAAEDALLYLDNGASTQTAQAVLDAMAGYYQGYRANVHRAGHPWAARATAAFEQSRDAVKDWLKVERREAVIFTSGTTAAINLVAWGLIDQVRQGDLILVSAMEHHANLVPWQLLARRTGATIKVIPLDANGRLDLAAYDQLLALKPKLVACCHVSNTLGLINPVVEICAKARAAGALSLIDGAQAVAHLEVDIQAIGCDFYAFSGHKMFGPTGVGVLTGRLSSLGELLPFMGGGEMIDKVSFDAVSFNALPHRLEAGTGPIAEVIGLGEAVKLVQALDAGAHERQLTERLLAGLAKLPVQVLGQGERISLVSITVPGVHHSDLAHYLAGKGIAVRAGHHCTQPLHGLLGIAGSLRIALAPYNAAAEVDACLAALADGISLFKEMA
ncbi:cysteine desulfurase [Gallaecimonas kandeliae]|uniref:aminotransferase class V-fold PLP-dependent enzyme n=1 Tax=Gallaecimonas kandeliae TaxID=3029055 RepID=UPI0026493593|nr:cysteine desulfurase [Gallaecimonas kandeliae]WKE64819.1 cysteine desulfurase [Gallaecimonas kandeliae]